MQSFADWTADFLAGMVYSVAALIVVVVVARWAFRRLARETASGGMGGPYIDAYCAEPDNPAWEGMTGSEIIAFEFGPSSCRECGRSCDCTD